MQPTNGDFSVRLSFIIPLSKVVRYKPAKHVTHRSRDTCSFRSDKPWQCREGQHIRATVWFSKGLLLPDCLEYPDTVEEPKSGRHRETSLRSHFWRTSNTTMVIARRSHPSPLSAHESIRRAEKVPTLLVSWIRLLFCTPWCYRAPNLTLLRSAPSFLLWVFKDRIALSSSVMSASAGFLDRHRRCPKAFTDSTVWQALWTNYCRQVGNSSGWAKPLQNRNTAISFYSHILPTFSWFSQKSCSTESP